MNWTEIIVNISSKNTQEVTDILHMTTIAGMYIEDYSNIEEELINMENVEIIDEELLNRDKDSAMIHIYIEPDENPQETIVFIQERLKTEGICFEIDLKNIKEEDWANNWKKYFKPMEVGNKITIKPTWEEYDNTENRTVLEIDPSMSFGSGQHETTRLCMELLEDYINEDTNMLDVGTGSGILSVEALLLGAEHVTAVDLDPMSVRIAGENAKLNKVEDKMDIFQNDLIKGINGKYNLVTANIVADIIIRMLEDIDNVIMKNGILIASGIIDIREDDVLTAIKNSGFEILEIKRERGWAAIAASKL